MLLLHTRGAILLRENYQRSRFDTTGAHIYLGTSTRGATKNLRTFQYYPNIQVVRNCGAECTNAQMHQDDTPIDNESRYLATLRFFSNFSTTCIS